VSHDSTALAGLRGRIGIVASGAATSATVQGEIIDTACAGGGGATVAVGGNKGARRAELGAGV
jgi:hypothetical protein